MKGLLRWLGFGLVVGTFIFLLDELETWKAFVFFFLSGLGWMSVFILGLPEMLLSDSKDILPADTKEKLE